VRELGNRNPETGIELQTANRAAFATCGLKPQASSLKPAVEAAGGNPEGSGQAAGWGGAGNRWPRNSPGIRLEDYHAKHETIG